MTDPRQFRLRVTYGKTGRLAMLSHLEVTHALERTVRRAGLPYALSNGFSPHMKIAFGGALPVGVGGIAEIFDLILSRYMAPAKALEALQAAAPADMMPTAAEYVEPRAKAASVAYPFGMYAATFDRPVSHVEWPDEVEVVRKKKTKVLVVSDYLVGLPEASGCDVCFQLQAKDTGSLRPDVFAKSMRVEAGREEGGSDSDSAPAVPVLRSVTRVRQSQTQI